MAIEIERKFLVRDDTWRGVVTHTQQITDGLIAVAERRKVRVRICDRRATLTVKAKTETLANAEFEYEIPLADAEELLAGHCVGPPLSKTRSFVPNGRYVWQVDEYAGLLAGVILAEIELPSETAEFDLPPWIGREVTGEAAYKKINMVNARRTATPS